MPGGRNLAFWAGSNGISRMNPYPSKRYGFFVSQRVFDDTGWKPKRLLARGKTSRVFPLLRMQRRSPRLSRIIKGGYAMHYTTINKCPHCGSAELDLVHEYTQCTTSFQVLACKCGKLPSVAATRTCVDRERIMEWGPLKTDGRHYIKHITDEGIDEGVFNCEVVCEACFKKAERTDWTALKDVKDPEVSEETYQVWCRNCGEEVRLEWEALYIQVMNLVNAQKRLADSAL
jgi:hypothetical protein